MMRQHKAVILLSVLLGAVMMYSGTVKVLNTAGFIDIVELYQFPTVLTWLAYAIPLFELVLGSALVLQLNHKRMAMTTFALLTMFTIIYLYGYLALGIEACGCFGQDNLLDSSPMLIIARNLILLSIAGSLWRLDIRRRAIRPYSVFVIGIIALVGAFVSGKSSVTSEIAAFETPVRVPMQGKVVMETALGGLAYIDKDRNVLVFVFGMNCPDCWDAIENIKAYKRSGTVDEIVGLTFGTESELSDFVATFEADFPIRLHPVERLAAITPILPKVFIIEKGLVTAEMDFPIPSFHSFKGKTP